MELSRFAVVRDVPGDRWATVVAALLDGVSLVVADVPRGLRAGDARRLVARARERSTVLVMVVPPRGRRGRPTPRCGSGPRAARGPGWSRAVGCSRRGRCGCGSKDRGVRSGVRTVEPALALTG